MDIFDVQKVNEFLEKVGRIAVSLEKIEKNIALIANSSIFDPNFVRKWQESPKT